MNVLVTGGAGFIGSHLVEALLARGDFVRVLDDLSTGKRENVPPSAELIVGDIANFTTVHEAMAGCHLVFHQAALVSVPLSLREPARNHRINVDGTFNVFEAARQHGIKRVVYASSSAVYGDVQQLPTPETAPIAPLTPYGLSKWQAEQYATIYNANYQTEFVGLRYFNVFGPRQDPSSPYSGVLSIFAQAVQTGRPITIFGDGEQTRDFVYVADVVQANLLASAIPFSAENAVFNVGRGEQSSLNLILDFLQNRVAQSLVIRYAEARDGDIRHSVADIGLIRALGFVPRHQLQTGLDTLCF